MRKVKDYIFLEKHVSNKDAVKGWIFRTALFILTWVILFVFSTLIMMFVEAIFSIDIINKRYLWIDFGVSFVFTFAVLWAIFD